MVRNGRCFCMLGVLAAGLAGCSHLDTAGFPPLAAAARHDVDTRFSMARLHERQGQLGKARDLYSEIWTQDRTNAVACHRLGVVSSRLGHHDQAMAFFAEARRLDPHNSDILTDMGYALYVQNNFAAAEHHLKRALEMNPQDRRATNNLALVVGHQGRTDESLALFRRAVTDAEANANVAYIHLQRGEGDKASDHYSRSLSLDSQLKASSHALVQIAEMQHAAPPKPPGNEPALLHVAAAAPLAPAPKTPAASPIQLVAAERDVADIVGNKAAPPDDLPPGEGLAAAEPKRLAPPAARPAAMPRHAAPAVSARGHFPIPVRTGTTASAGIAPTTVTPPARIQATAAFSTQVTGPNASPAAAAPRRDLHLMPTVVTNPYGPAADRDAGAVQTGALQTIAPPAAPGPVIVPGPVRQMPKAPRPAVRTPFGIRINPGPRTSLPPTR